jgi:hypothetical protein
LWEGKIRLEDVNTPVLEVTEPPQDGTTTVNLLHIAGKATDDIGLANPAVTIKVTTFLRSSRRSWTNPERLRRICRSPPV